MLGNTKPKGDKPQAPPPPPMKPQNIEDEDCKPTVEEVASAFGVPPHLLSQPKEGSFYTHTAIENAQIGFIKKERKRMQRLIKDYEKRLAELEKLEVEK